MTPDSCFGPAPPEAFEATALTAACTLAHPGHLSARR